MSSVPAPRLAVATLASSLVVLAAGCPLLAVEAELPAVCMTHRGIDVPGVPAGAATGIHETFAFDDLSAFDDLVDLDDARFVSAAVRATHGVGTLAFIDAASLEIASNDPHSTLPARTVYACDGDCPAEDDALVIPVQDQPDALDYLRSGSLSIALRARGAMPAEAWALEVELCVAARASYTFEP